jgi:cystathionine gamma-synthase
MFGGGSTVSDAAARQSWGSSTRALWAGEESLFPYGAVVMPIVQNIAFGYDTLAEWHDVAIGEHAGHIYSRNTNPTVALFEEKMRQLEGAQAAIAFSSGMAAISNTLLTFVQPGQQIVSMTETYGGTNRLFSEFLPRNQIRIKLARPEDQGGLEALIDGGTTLVYLESPTNPTLQVVDIARVSKAAKQAGAIVVVDNTIATPVNQNPLALGADLVIHSASKFLGGHGDALGGVLCGSRDLVESVFRYREIHGAALDPFAAFLLMRGLKTLAIRMERHNNSALQIARFLVDHPAIERVFYPGLPSHPGHVIASRQMRGSSGMLSFVLKEGGATVAEVLQRLRLARRAASLGHVETFAGVPSTTSHVECSAEQRKAMGIPELLIRYSVGIEDVSDLLADLESALA